MYIPISTTITMITTLTKGYKVTLSSDLLRATSLYIIYRNRPNLGCPKGPCEYGHYTLVFDTNYKTIFFAEQGNRTHRYMLEPIPLSAIRTIASMTLSSHALLCETGVGAQVMRVADYAHFALNKFESLSIIL
mgnify:CR=1 FL=1